MICSQKKNSQPCDVTFDTKAEPAVTETSADETTDADDLTSLGGPANRR